MNNSLGIPIIPSYIPLPMIGTLVYTTTVLPMGGQAYIGIPEFVNKIFLFFVKDVKIICR